MHNGKLDEAALLAGGKGVFAKTSYVGFGNKDKPEPYVTTTKDRPSFLGKQLSTQALKEGKTIDTYFEKKHNWISDGDKYIDKTMYKDKQADTKKKGFSTSDWSKRDEFSNTIRTCQYREQLAGEAKFTKKALELLGDTGTDAAVLASYTTQKADDDYFYDRVFEKEETGFNGASKTHRETKNKCNLSVDRSYGATMTSNSLAYQAPSEFEKPEHARKPIVHDTFYRKTNIFFPAGISADPV